MVTLVQNMNAQCLVPILQDTYSKSFQVHQPTMIYCFEHTNHGIHLIFLFQNLDKLFLCELNLHQ